MAALNEYRFAWLLDIFQTSTIRVATRDLPIAAQDHANTLTTIGGVPYDGRMLNSPTITKALNRYGAGVVLPIITPIRLDNSDEYFSPAPAQAWVQTRVRLRRLDAMTPAVSTEFSGIIIDAVFLPGVFQITLGSVDEVAMQTLVPKVIVTTGAFGQATDVGKAIPVVYGAGAMVRPPYVGYTEVNDTDGDDFVVSHDGTTTVDAVFADQDAEHPGLERWPTNAYSTSSTDYSGYRSLRLFAADQGTAPLVEASRTGSALGNPANTIKDILSNATYGLGESVRTGAGEGSFDTAVTDLTNATLSTASRGALGHDGQQVRALDVLDDLCSLRGMRLENLLQSDDTLKWELRVDKAPGAATETLGFNDGLYNNIKEVLSYRKTPALTETVKQLSFRYAIEGRRRRAALSPNEYQYEITRTVHATGRNEVRVSPWIRVFDDADRILWYWTRTLYHAAEQVEVVTDPESRTLTVGDVVNVVAPDLGIDTAKTMRVAAIEKRLADQRILLWGYNASDIFSGYSAQSAPAVLNRDERRRVKGSGANLLRNADFSQLTVSQQPYEWGVTDLTVTLQSEPLAISGLKLKCEKTTVNSGKLVMRAAGVFAIPQQSNNFIASCYVDTTTNVSFQVDWYDWNGSSYVLNSSSLLTPIADANDTNSAGWTRIFARFRRPSTVKGCRVGIIFGTTSTYTRYIEAAQFELVSGRNWATPWRRFQPWDVDMPMRELTYDRTTGARTNEQQTSEEITISASSPYVDTTAIIPANSRANVTIRVTQAISPSTSIDIGWVDLTNAWGDNVAVALGTTTSYGNFRLLYDPMFTAATAVRITFNGGNATAGKIRVTVHARVLGAATS